MKTLFRTLLVAAVPYLVRALVKRMNSPTRVGAARHGSPGTL
jgi:hypothetical protein